MSVLDYPAIGFIVIFLASLLMFGEFLVKAKGIFGTISAVLFILYFIHHLPGQSPALMITMLVVGLICIIFDGKLINNGSVAIVGLLLMMLACALPVPTVTYGIVAASAFLIGTVCAFFFLKVFPARNYWSKITLMEQLTSDKGYDSMSVEYKVLVGQKGKTLTACRPVGTIEINGQSYSGVTNGTWLEKGKSIEVVAVDGTRIMIKPIDD
ncbi:NfeD family protein [Camelliibacillus cellulosilyticus]|uniref:NfeD family protein n=1 Tax=Camelliibacillus cellulosilyticus TaxID=2174486 RepID=A0ABV9GL60_9BACL